MPHQRHDSFRAAGKSTKSWHRCTFLRWTWKLSSTDIYEQHVHNLYLYLSQLMMSKFCYRCRVSFPFLRHEVSRLLLSLCFFSFFFLYCCLLFIFLISLLFFDVLGNIHRLRYRFSATETRQFLKIVQISTFLHLDPLRNICFLLSFADRND